MFLPRVNNQHRHSSSASWIHPFKRKGFSEGCTAEFPYPIPSQVTALNTGVTLCKLRLEDSWSLFLEKLNSFYQTSSQPETSPDLKWLHITYPKWQTKRRWALNQVFFPLQDVFNRQWQKPLPGWFINISLVHKKPTSYKLCHPSIHLPRAPQTPGKSLNAQTGKMHLA